MKTVKWLLLLVVGFVLVVPAVAQDVKEAKKVLPKVLQEEQAEALPAEAPAPLAVPVGKLGEAQVVHDSGSLNSYVYYIHTYPGGMIAEAASKNKDHTIVLEKFADRDTGRIQTAKYCSGDEDACKVVTNGRVCDRHAAPPADFCYLSDKLPEDVALPELEFEEIYEAIEACK